MKKARLLAGMTAAIPVAAGGFAAHGAQAATAAHQVRPAKGKTVLQRGTVAPLVAHGPAWYSVINGTLYARSGGLFYPNPYSGSVHVTCYYSGNTGYRDPYWDHFVSLLYPRGRERGTGHVADEHVDMEGKVPPNNGIPHC